MPLFGGIDDDGAEPVVDQPRVGVEDQHVRVAEVAALGIVRAGDAEAVALSRLDTRQKAVPDERGALLQRHACLAAVRVEQADVDARRRLGVDGEVRAASVGMRPLTLRRPWPRLHPRRLEALMLYALK